MHFQNEKYDNRRASSPKTIAWVFGGLFGLALITAIFFGIKNENLQNRQYELSMNLDTLDKQRLGLENELTTLDNSYQLQITENGTLSSTLEERLKEVEALKGRVWTAKQSLSKSEEKNKAINSRLEELEVLKQELENDITSLEETNEELTTTNDQLASDIKDFQEETKILDSQLQTMQSENKALVERLYQLAPAGFVANNFTVTAEKRNNKLTAKAKQADKINVSFDINDVPVEFRDKEEIYLVLTQFDGNPVEDVNSKEIKVASIDPVVINVVDRTNMNLKERQNVEMSFETDRDLESGTYNLMVYADHGFLGSTTFQLR